MKKMILSLFAAVAMTTTAQAGSISADLRADYDSTSYNDDSGKPGVSKFNIQTGRVDFKGNLNEEVSYRLRLRFNKDRAVSQRDSVGADTDFAYISNKVSDGLTLTLGKFASGIGGFEGGTSGADIYLASAAYAGPKTLYPGVGSIVGLSNLLYYTGAQLAYAINDSNKIELHAANTEATVGTDYKTGASVGDVIPQNKTLTGLVYRGSFADKTFNLLATYHMETAGDKDNKISLAAIGFEYLMNGMTAQLDLLANNYDVAGATITKNSMNSTVLTVKYKTDQWTPILKVAMTDEKLGAAVDVKNKYTDYGVAVEYAPKADQMFRYHIAYNARSVKPDSGNKNPASTQILVGTRILADFLK